MKKYSDQELMKLLNIDSNTLKRFKKIQEDTIKEAKNLAEKTKARKKIKILGISGSARDEFDTAQEKSNSEELLKKCLDYCKKLGADIELIQLRKYNIQHCKACYSTCNTQCHFYCSCYPKGTKQGDDMSNILYDKILNADGIIFATPVNNYSMSTLMKTFIDRTISLDGSLKPANLEKPKDKELNIKHMKFVELAADENIPGSGMLKRFMGKTAGFIVTGHEEGASMVISSLYMYLNGCGMIFPPFNYVYAMSSVCNSTYEDKPIVTSKCYDLQTELLAKNILNSIKINNNKTIDWKYDYTEN
ncbi:MAG: NAD(P)H-dependent oxidoreductase [Candidatus Nanoarchaeia archaeon]|nr:NAD(P)H-dependent oxidoreductase [Candidatus Nanoarchaeia archaeon]